MSRSAAIAKPRVRAGSPSAAPGLASSPREAKKAEEQAARRRLTEQEVKVLDKAMRELAQRCRVDYPILRTWDHEDLVQEGLHRAIDRLHHFRGESSLKTWATITARNHYMSLARKAKIRPKPLGDAPVGPIRKEQDPGRALVLRTSTKDLLGWLRANPQEIAQGWEVLNLLLWSHANYSYVALAMTLHTGMAWTQERVRNVVREIQTTTHGRALCEAVGIK